MSILIVDNEISALNLLESLLIDCGVRDPILRAQNVHEAFNLTMEHNPQLVFLDIQLNKLNGFDYIKRLGKFRDNMSIVVVTAFKDHAIEAIKNNAFDFLLKPVNPDELQIVLTKYYYRQTQREFQSINNNKTKIKLPGISGSLLLYPEEIMHLKADGSYTYAYLNENNVELCSANLGKIESLLPEDSFFRISRSAIINTQFLKKIDRKNKVCKLSRDCREYLDVKYSRNYLKALEDQL